MVTQKTSLSSPATDPLRNFKFQVILTPLNATGAGGGGTSITLGFMTVQGLAANIDSIPYREGNMNAQPLSAKVLTMNRGWVRMGDLEVGDRVVDPRGQDSKVAGIYPKGKRAVYAVTLADGSKTEACYQHLWEVETISHQAKKVLTTLELKAALTRGHGIRVPEMLPMQFEAISELPLDPYLLGVLISEGTLGRGQVSFTQNPATGSMMVERVRQALPDGHYLRTEANGTHHIITGLRGPGARNIFIGRNKILDAVRVLGIANHRSWEKFIPEVYKFASVEDRLALLQGIMDGDGCVFKDGQISYSSSSERLRNDVRDLIFSLGGRSTSGEVRNVMYTSPNQTTPKAARDAYRLNSVQMHLNPFYIECKASHFISKNSAYHRKVVSVEYVRDEDVQCIMVSADSHLYVTDSYIPTHNTVTQQMPGQTSFNPITLSHGVICGQTGGPLEVNMLQQIFTVNQGSGTQAPGMNFRYKADIQVLDHPVTTQDAPVKAWFIVHNAWTTAFAWGDLDAGANQTLVAQLSMVHEGFDVSYAAGVGTSAASAPDTLQ